jgi:hypothetical protein
MNSVAAPGGHPIEVLRRSVRLLLETGTRAIATDRVSITAFSNDVASAGYAARATVQPIRYGDQCDSGNASGCTALGGARNGVQRTIRRQQTLNTVVTIDPIAVGEGPLQPVRIRVSPLACRSMPSIAPTTANGPAARPSCRIMDVAAQCRITASASA